MKGPDTDTPNWKARPPIIPATPLTGTPDNPPIIPAPPLFILSLSKDEKPGRRYPNGGPGRVRTCDQPVMSRLLCH